MPAMHFEGSNKEAGIKENTFQMKVKNKICAATRQNQQNGYAHSEDSDQPVHPPTLIRVFAVRSMGS